MVDLQRKAKMITDPNLGSELQKKRMKKESWTRRELNPGFPQCK